MASRFLAAAVWSLLITEAAVLPQQPVSRLEDRLRDYIERFEQEASALVAEEEYLQRRWGLRGEARRMRSEYVLLKPSDTQPWLGYRDIFEVDGRAVRDRDDRLVKVLSSTAPDSRERALAMVDEGARFNVGPRRTTNVPTLPIQMLARAHAARFRLQAPRGWERDSEVEVRFDEIVRPTIIRTPEGESVESRGEMTVRVADGAILEAGVRFYFRNERTLETSREWGARMSVTYGEVPGISVPVPLKMTEVVAGTEGTATYSNYRRFQTTGRIR